MRILFEVMGSRGDIDPIAAVGQVLRQRGHAVRVIAPTDARATIERHDLEFVDAELDLQSWLSSRPGLIEGRRRVLFDLTRWVGHAIDREYARLERHVPWADVVVGAGIINGPSSVAAALRRPYRYVAFHSSSIPSRQHPPWILPLGSFPRWSYPAIWWVADVGLSLVAATHMNRNRRRLGLGRVTSVSRTIVPPGRTILAADGYLSPPPTGRDAPVAVTGFWRGSQPGGLDARVRAFLDAGTPPIYVGFGSMPDRGPGRTTRLVAEAAERLGARLIVAAGWARLGEDLPPTCLVVGETAHAELFPHLAGVVHHGGAGTTAAAAAAGVPQMAVPHLFDQFLWGRRVAELGLGPRPIPRARLDGRGLAGALGSLKKDEGMRLRAERLAPRVRDRDGTAEGADAIEKAAAER